MKDLCMRTSILLHAEAENSRDLKRIADARRKASELQEFASEYKHRRFDIADDLPEEGEFALIVEWDSEAAERHAERLLELAEEMEKEAYGFYQSIGIRIKGGNLKETVNIRQFS